MIERGEQRGEGERQRQRNIVGYIMGKVRDCNIRAGKTKTILGVIICQNYPPPPFYTL